MSDLNSLGYLMGGLGVFTVFMVLLVIAVYVVYALGVQKGACLL